MIQRFNDNQKRPLNPFGGCFIRCKPVSSIVCLQNQFLRLLLSNGLGESLIWIIYAHKDQLVVFTLLLIGIGSQVQGCVNVYSLDILMNQKAIYVIPGEHPDENVTEIESRDVDFLKEKFPRRGDVDKNLGLYEIYKPEECAQIPTSKIENDYFSSQSVPLYTGSQDPQQCKSKCVSISCHCFEIEGEAFMYAPQDDDKPKTYREALTSPTSKK